MKKRELIDARTWPVKMAKKIMKRMKNRPIDQIIILETGFSPSGLPHLGTILEVLRTRMIQGVLEQLQDRKVKIIAYCDNLDGLRSIPTNIPNQEMLQNYYGIPIIKVPDPFEKYDSFAAYNTKIFKDLLQTFDLEKHIVFYESDKQYASGLYNNELLELLKKHKEILDIILPTLREERQQTYSHFMPISPITGKVLDTGVIAYNVDRGTVTVQEGKEEYEVPVTDGKCKLQWKIDFGMRWAALNLDCELHGKDIISSC